MRPRTLNRVTQLLSHSTHLQTQNNNVLQCVYSSVCVSENKLISSSNYILVTKCGGRALVYGRHKPDRGLQHLYDNSLSPWLHHIQKQKAECVCVSMYVCMCGIFVCVYVCLSVGSISIVLSQRRKWHRRLINRKQKLLLPVWQLWLLSLIITSKLKY